MISQEQINEGLLPCLPQNYNEDFVAAAIQIGNDGEAKHAGILINCDEGTFLCHFDGSEILIDDEVPEGWYFFKDFKYLDGKLSTAFLGQCKTIQEFSNPNYGYYYEGSFYDAQGRYFSEIVKEEYMTCVGFCINALKGFLCEGDEEEFFVYQDWTGGALPQGYLDHFVSRVQFRDQQLTVEQIKENIRRIPPDDYLASAYLKKIPVRKKDISKFIEPLKSVLRAKIANQLPVQNVAEENANNGEPPANEVGQAGREQA